MGWFIAFGILFLLAILPLGVSIVYNADGPLIRVKAGPLGFQVFPSKKKTDKPPKPKKETSKDKPATGTNGGKHKGGAVSDFMPFVAMIVDLLVDFRHKLRVDLLQLKVILAGGDPADLAINYGKAWAALGNLWPRLETWFVIKKRDVEVECDFEGASTAIAARLDLSITLGRLLGLLARYGCRGLKEFLNFRKKRKGGTTL